jgi:hypothetical protein
VKDEYYNFKKEAEAKIKEQNERIIDLMTLLREASMGDKDSNDAICQTDITGKIIAYTNLEGIAAAAIELKIFSSALTGGSKSKEDDKKKLKKQKTRKFNNKQVAVSFDSAEENSLDEDGNEERNKGNNDEVVGIDEIDEEYEENEGRSRRQTQRANGVTVSDKFTGDAARVVDADIDNDNTPLTKWNDPANKVPKSRMESDDLENTVKRE